MAIKRMYEGAHPCRPWLLVALLAVLELPAPARAAEKPAAKDKGAAADKPGDKSADKERYVNQWIEAER